MRDKVWIEAEEEYLRYLKWKKVLKTDRIIYEMSDDELHEFCWKTVEELGLEKEADDFNNEWCRGHM